MEISTDRGHFKTQFQKPSALVPSLTSTNLCGTGASLLSEMVPPNTRSVRLSSVVDGLREKRAHGRPKAERGEDEMNLQEKMKPWLSKLHAEDEACCYLVLEIEVCTGKAEYACHRESYSACCDEGECPLKGKDAMHTPRYRKDGTTRLR